MSLQGDVDRYKENVRLDPSVHLDSIVEQLLPKILPHVRGPIWYLLDEGRKNMTTAAEDVFEEQERHAVDRINPDLQKMHELSTFLARTNTERRGAPSRLIVDTSRFNFNQSGQSSHNSCTRSFGKVS